MPRAVRHRHESRELTRPKARCSAPGGARSAQIASAAGKLLPASMASATRSRCSARSSSTSRSARRRAATRNSGAAQKPSAAVAAPASHAAAPRRDAAISTGRPAATPSHRRVTCQFSGADNRVSSAWRNASRMSSRPRSPYTLSAKTPAAAGNQEHERDLGGTADLDAYPRQPPQQPATECFEADHERQQLGGNDQADTRAAPAATAAE